MNSTITHKRADASAITPIPLRDIAAEAFATLGSGRQISPFSLRYPSFTLDDAYRVTDLVRQLRKAGGEKAIVAPRTGAFGLFSAICCNAGSNRNSAT